MKLEAKDIQVVRCPGRIEFWEPIPESGSAGLKYRAFQWLDTAFIGIRPITSLSDEELRQLRLRHRRFGV